MRKTRRKTQMIRKMILRKMIPRIMTREINVILKMLEILKMKMIRREIEEVDPQHGRRKPIKIN
jgi:hypothetical protein